MKEHQTTENFLKQKQIVQAAAISAAQHSQFPLKDSLTIKEVERWSAGIADNLRKRGYKLIKTAATKQPQKQT